MKTIKGMKMPYDPKAVKNAVTNVIKKHQDVEEKITIVPEQSIATGPEPVMSIHDKFRVYISQYKSGYLRGLSYADAMEILRYCEKKIGKPIPIDYGCGSCMMGLIKTFSNYENC